MGALRGVRALVVGFALMAAGIGLVLLGVFSGSYMGFAVFGVSGVGLAGLGFLFFKLGTDVASGGETLGLPKTHTVEPLPEERARQNSANVKIVAIMLAATALLVLFLVMAARS